MHILLSSNILCDSANMDVDIRKKRMLISERRVGKTQGKNLNIASASIRVN